MQVGTPTPGEPLADGDILTADWLNALLDIWQRNRVVVPRDEFIRAQYDVLGTFLSVDLDRGFWIKITSGGAGGKYAWTLQNDATAGTFTDTSPAVGGTTSVDPAYELSLYTGVTAGTYVRAWRGVSTGEVRFLASTC